MKKTAASLSLTLVFAMLGMFLPLAGENAFTAYAADGFFVEDGVLTEYSGPDGAVAVPGYVKVIGNYAFEGRSGVTSVIIPSSVTRIGNYAFEGCSALKSVAIPDSVTSIGQYAFFSCTSLTGVTIPGSVTFIDEGAFFECSALKSITLPDSVTNIADYLFGGCSGLTSVTIPNSVTGIGRYAFQNCTGLKSLSLPKSVTGIGEYAFEGCTGLQTVSLPNSVTSMDMCAFSGCVGLKSLAIPNSVTVIDRYLLEDCTGLTSVSIPNSVTKISGNAFINCKGLTSVTIPSSVTVVESQAFLYCSGLKTVTILTKRASVAEEYVFEGCTAVTDVYYAGSQSEWLASGFDKEFDYPVRIHYNCADFAITAQPKSRSIAIGKSLTLSVKAIGSGLKYQWYFKKSGQTSWSIWNNRTHASETVTPNATWDGIQLYCVVKDDVGRSAKSSTATVRVLSIATQPKSQTVSKGSSLTLSVKATGSGLNYQWHFKKKGQTSWNVWKGHTHASETCVPNDTWDGIQLYCLVKDGAGNSVKSNTATITLFSEPVITAQPKNQYIVLGKSLTMSVKASGSGLKYQWYFKKKGQSSWSVWDGRTHASETVTPNVSWDGIQLYCKVTDGGGKSVNSSAMSVSVLSIATQPANKTVTAGNSVTLFLKATGSGLTYQWYYKKSGQSEFSLWKGRTHASEAVLPNATWNGIKLYCVVKDSAGHSVQSNTITVTVR